jgi:hypothetical protein
MAHTENMPPSRRQNDQRALMNNWVKQQFEFLNTLRGNTIIDWLGAEMAVRESGKNGLPQWYDDSIAVLQFSRIDMVFSNSQFSSILTYQNDDHWGLYRKDDLPILKFQNMEPTSIFRERHLIELPIGKIDSIEITLDKETDDISEVKLDICGKLINLMAGEVYENPNNKLQTVKMDESVLVQLDSKRPFLPSFLDGAKVLFVSKKIEGFGFSEKNGSNDIPIRALALAQYNESKEVYLFACDSDWNIVGDLYFSSISDAKVEAEKYYESKYLKWHTVTY